MIQRSSLMGPRARPTYARIHTIFVAVIERVSHRMESFDSVSFFRSTLRVQACMHACYIPPHKPHLNMLECVYLLHIPKCHHHGAQILTQCSNGNRGGHSLFIPAACACNSCH